MPVEVSWMSSGNSRSSTGSSAMSANGRLLGAGHGGLGLPIALGGVTGGVGGGVALGRALAVDVRRGGVGLVVARLVVLVAVAAVRVGGRLEHPAVDADDEE